MSGDGQPVTDHDEQDKGSSDWFQRCLTLKVQNNWAKGRGTRGGSRWRAPVVAACRVL